MFMDTLLIHKRMHNGNLREIQAIVAISMPLVKRPRLDIVSKEDPRSKAPDQEDYSFVGGTPSDTPLSLDTGSKRMLRRRAGLNVSISKQH
jgi:hypothetical protein